MHFLKWRGYTDKFGGHCTYVHNYVYITENIYKMFIYTNYFPSYIKVKGKWFDSGICIRCQVVWYHSFARIWRNVIAVDSTTKLLGRYFGIRVLTVVLVLNSSLVTLYVYFSKNFSDIKSTFLKMYCYPYIDILKKTPAAL